MEEETKQAFRDWMHDQGLVALIITGLTVLLSIFLSELQTKLGWGTVVLSLFTILTIFGITFWLIQRPLKHILVSLGDDLRKLLEPRKFSWLLDTEQLAQYEQSATVSEIWLLTSDLLDDAQGGPFLNVVKKNLQRKVRHVYFVPNTPEVRARVEMIKEFHKNHPLLKVVYLPDTFFFLVPKFDVCIYNPLSQDKSIRAAYMGLPTQEQANHYHAAVSIDFIDKLVGVLLDEYKKQVHW